MKKRSGCVAMVTGSLLLAALCGKASAVVWTDAWAPTNVALRGIVLNARGFVFEAPIREPWISFCQSNGLAWVNITAWDRLQTNILQDIGAQLGHPALDNAPIVWAGLSASSAAGIEFANRNPDRVIGVVGAVPVVPFVQGNDAFNFNRPKFEGLFQSVQNVSNTFSVPMLIQVGARDATCGSAPAYGFVKYGRRQNAPWTYYCILNGTHNAPAPVVEMPWLAGVLAQRLPADVDLSKGKPVLRPIILADGWLGHTQTRATNTYADYEDDKTKAVWLPDAASAAAWRNAGTDMPYDFPEQTQQLPAGIITNLVVQAETSQGRNRIVPSDVIWGDGWKIVANLKEGDTYCLTDDRRFCMTVLGRVPPLVRGCDWIKPDGLGVTSTNAVLLEFTVTQDVIVYVGHDETLADKPAWLAGWKDTAEYVLGGYLGNERRFRLFAKAFPRNTRVQLGPNGESGNPVNWGSYAGWIYMTLVKPSSLPAGSPIANAQSVSTAEDAATAITLTGSDPRGGGLTYGVMTQPAHGTVTGTAPNLTYRPSPDFSGTDSFTFKVNAGTLDSYDAAVSITVTAVNDQPTVIAGVTSTNGAAPFAVALTSAGADVDGDTLSYAWTFGDGATSTAQHPSHIYASVGSYTATVTVADGHGGTASSSKVITVAAGSGTGGVLATGGAAIYDYTTNGITYRVHRFSTVGSNHVVISHVDGDGAVDYLVVGGGGGGGGGWEGGGGGAGGMLTGTTNVTKGTLSVVVGGGGLGCNRVADKPARNGSHSSFGAIVAIGGGCGASGTPQAHAGVGGSGGGGTAGSMMGAEGTAGQGHAGGAGYYAADGQAGGGGGGAGGSGSTNTNVATAPGGPGRSSSLAGFAVTYAAGGMGRKRTLLIHGLDGAANTGNGGEGGCWLSSMGGNGGSGIVLLRYVRSAVARQTTPANVSNAGHTSEKQTD